MEFKITNETNEKIEFIMIDFELRDSHTPEGEWSFGGDTFVYPFDDDDTYIVNYSKLKQDFFHNNVVMIGNLTSVVYKIEGKEDTWIHMCDSREAVLDTQRDIKNKK